MIVDKILEDQLINALHPFITGHRMLIAFLTLLVLSVDVKSLGFSLLYMDIATATNSILAMLLEANLLTLFLVLIFSFFFLPFICAWILKLYANYIHIRLSSNAIEKVQAIDNGGLDSDIQSSFFNRLDNEISDAAKARKTISGMKDIHEVIAWLILALLASSWLNAQSKLLCLVLYLGFMFIFSRKIWILHIKQLIIFKKIDRLKKIKSFN